MLECDLKYFVVVFFQKIVESDEAMATGVTSRVVSVRISESMLVASCFWLVMSLVSACWDVILNIFWPFLVKNL